MARLTFKPLRLGGGTLKEANHMSSLHTLGKSPSNLKVLISAKIYRLLGNALICRHSRSTLKIGNTE